MKLSGKQKRELRGLGHHLDPIIHVGKNGLDEPQFEAIRQALLDHELIKIKLGKSSPFNLKEMIEIVEKNTKAKCVQSIGKMGIFFARNADDPKIIFSNKASR